MGDRNLRAGSIRAVLRVQQLHTRPRHGFLYDRATLELILTEAGSLDTVDGMPDELLALESMDLEARKSHDPR